MEHVLDAGQVDALLPGEELDHTNPPDVILRIAAAVRRRSLRFDEVLALVDHQRARVEVEDLARDTWREDRPSGCNRRRPLSFSHALTPLGAARAPPALVRNFIPTISHIGHSRKPHVASV